MVGYGVYFLVINSFIMTEVNKFLASRYFCRFITSNITSNSTSHYLTKGKLLPLLKLPVSYTVLLHRFIR